MVITRIRKTDDKFRSVWVWEFKNEPGTKKQKKPRFPYKAKPITLGIRFSLARYPSLVLSD